MNHQKTRLNVWIEPAQVQQIDQLCAESGCTKAEVVRQLFSVALPHLAKVHFPDSVPESGE